MNIDLLIAKDGAAGLITSENLVKKVAGVVFDHNAGIMTLEFNDMDYMEMNIPIEPEFHARLDMCAQIHIGAIKNGHIAQAYQVPLLMQDDPYRAEIISQAAQQSKHPLQDFEYFVRDCAFGQPVHREDLGDESSMGCILGDTAPSSLEFAPHLARRYTLENAAKLGPHNAPRFSGPGLGGGSGGTVRYPSRDGEED